jgi:peptidoglycan/xylan/chitin deacetylase (PgdA/CDA1 family)
MKNSLAVKKALQQSGLASFQRRLAIVDSTAILRYHAVVSPRKCDYAAPGICLSPARFEAQIQYLANHYNVISLDDVASCLKIGRPFPKASIVLTFDDGYRDNYLAHLILKKYGVHGTFYVAAGCIGDGEVFWLSEVICRIRNTGQKHLEISMPDEVVSLDLGSENNRAAAIRRVIELIKSNNLEVREEIRAQLKEHLNDVRGCGERVRQIMLTWDQVREMHRNGMTIAGHTLTHLNLPNADPADAYREIAGCKELLEQKLECPVRHFSYPNGGNYRYYNPAIIEMVREAGFVTATTSNNGVVLRGSDLLELRRIRITDHIPEIVYQIDCEPVVQRLKTQLRPSFGGNPGRSI